LPFSESHVIVNRGVLGVSALVVIASSTVVDLWTEV